MIGWRGRIQEAAPVGEVRTLDRIIFHCDLNSFYASVELLGYPELRD